MKSIQVSVRFKDGYSGRWSDIYRGTSSFGLSQRASLKNAVWNARYNYVKSKGLSSNANYQYRIERLYYKYDSGRYKAKRFAISKRQKKNLKKKVLKEESITRKEQLKEMYSREDADEIYRRERRERFEKIQKFDKEKESF